MSNARTSKFIYLKMFTLADVARPARLQTEDQSFQLPQNKDVHKMRRPRPRLGMTCQSSPAAKQRSRCWMKAALNRLAAYDRFGIPSALHGAGAAVVKQSWRTKIRPNRGPGPLIRSMPPLRAGNRRNDRGSFAIPGTGVPAGAGRAYSFQNNPLWIRGMIEVNPRSAVGYRQVSKMDRNDTGA